MAKKDEMNKKVKELVERVRLTDEDKIKAQRKFIKEWGATTGQILTFPLQGDLREICLLSAQLNKVLNDPDLALIDRKQQLPDLLSTMGNFISPRDTQQNMLSAGYLPVIPLAEALKEVEG